ncbi:NAD(P)-binding protein [Coprinellus micaceus]|uniref:NAD(P)-binding protein n=1 Tax=Coprinellus micaceus TaxID=71717 RepID=A0A4Y7TGK9_COPMI|nr:NAD(P)-binding protein [Coprinellus micaceus]
MPSLTALLTLLADLFPSKPTFKAEDIPDLSGKVVIVTGANTGIGKETAKILLAHNAKVYIAARSPERGLQAIEDLKRETGKEALFIHLDLADLESVKKAAEDFLGKEEVLHVLFNNAGVMLAPAEGVTAQGYDLHFGTNVLGPFYFTSLLLPALLRGASSSPDGKARIVTTSSAASYLSHPIDFNTLKDGTKRRGHSAGWLYYQSKLGTTLMSRGFARKYGDQGIVSIAVHPGSIDSEVSRHTKPWQRAMMRWLVLQPVSYGALTQLYAGVMEEGAEWNGNWLRPWARLSDHPNPLASDEKLIEDVWKWCEDQVANI